jgi:hypothetical protein
MNIADKERLCAEIGRVVRPGGVFGLYDVMRLGSDPVLYPLQWAEIQAYSFVDRAEDYRHALRIAGFEVVSERNRREFALDFCRDMKSRAVEGVAPLGLHILMGTDAAVKIANMMTNLERGSIAPVQMIARRL